MRASDIVAQLAKTLPKHADDFTANVEITGITQAAGVATAITATAHGLVAGNQINITGSQHPIPCSITRVGVIATLVTTSDHDMTENAGFDVQISGATEPEFNGTFTLLSVPNRRTITFKVADSGALVATGSPLLLNGSSPLQSFNGLVDVVSVPTTTSFTYAVDSSLYATASGDEIVAKTLPRISAAVDYDVLQRAYTAQGPNAAWLFVVMGDAVANRNRNINGDSIDNIQPGNYFNQKLIQSVQLFLFYPSTNQIAARSARDRCEELLGPICKSLLTCKFPSLVENSNNPLMLTGHGFHDYNTAVYVHQYSFEATLQLGPSDIYQPNDDVAFRDISLDMFFQHGTGIDPYEAEINLDDEPL